MNKKEFSEFYKKIEVFEFEDTGYIYFYGNNISLCRQPLSEAVKEGLEAVISYCGPHRLTATIVLTRLRFWKRKQLALNKTLYKYGCHMDRETLTALYNCNEYVLSQSAKWQKNWQSQPVFKAAEEARKRGGDWMEMVRSFFA